LNLSFNKCADKLYNLRLYVSYLEQIVDESWTD
jgi:hypothetical protein